MGEPVHDDRPLRLKNPPIVEAAIGITVPKLPSDSLQRMSNPPSMGGGYRGPTPVTQSRLEMQILEGQSTALTQDERLGWRWDSEDKLHAVQFKLDGFAFSRLGKYDTWETFTQEAKRLWDIYLGVSGVEEVSLFGIRYINKVFVPEGEDLSHYLRVYPKVPDEGSAWLITESVMRLGLPITSPEPGMFIHQHVLVPSDLPGHVAVILDNDFRYQVGSVRAEDLWPRLDAVRRVKDQFFKDLITEKLLETFNV